MRIGKTLVVCCSKELPDFKQNLRLDENFAITWDEVFNWAEFRKKENYMKLVKESENYDMLINKGKFECHKDFNITFVCRYVKEDDFYNLLECLPRHKDYMKIAISNH